MSKRAKYFIIRIFVLCLGFFVGIGVGGTFKKPVKVYVEVPVVVEKIVEVEKQENNELGYKQIDVVATAYCPCEECSEGYGTITSTGVTAKAGRTIAVDPSVIPYGSNVYIEDFGKVFVAEDCGALIKGKKIDIFFDTHSEVEKFGKQNLVICVKED